MENSDPTSPTPETPAPAPENPAPAQPETPVPVPKLEQCFCGCPGVPHYHPRYADNSVWEKFPPDPPAEDETKG
jgi:hypothetical protein